MGWATGGGHGLATGTYGMGADNIIEAEIVTPAGDLATANAFQHEDLFWAIRGGGGGTYGVIVSVTVKAYPMPLVTMINLSLTANNATSEHEWYRLVAKAHGYLAELQNNGVHGYYTMSSSPQLNMNGALLLYNAKNGTAERLLCPFQNFLKAQETIVTSLVAPMMTLPLYDVVQMMPVVESVGKTQGVRASRFIPRRAVKEDVELLADTFEVIMSRNNSVGVSSPHSPLSSAHRDLLTLDAGRIRSFNLRHHDRQCHSSRQRSEHGLERFSRTPNRPTELERIPPVSLGRTDHLQYDVRQGVCPSAAGP